MVFFLSSLWEIRIRGFWKLPDGRDWLWGKLGLVLMAMLSKSLIQFSVDGWSCDPSLLFGLRPSYGGGNEENLQKVQWTHCHTHCPWPWAVHHRHASVRDSWTCTGKSRSVYSGVTTPFSWVLVHIRFCGRAEKWLHEEWTDRAKAKTMLSCWCDWWWK